MEYCVMCVDIGCFGAKVKLMFLFSVLYSLTVGPRDCVKWQRYSYLQFIPTNPAPVVPSPE
jgi:hypothetical protein